eukprot:gene5101-8700_t
MKEKKIDTSTSAMVWSKIIDEATNKIVSSLIENDSVSEKYFNLVSKILLPKHYKEVIFERSCEGKCGNQFCSKKPQTTYQGKYYFKDGKIEETDKSLQNSFCSKLCFEKTIHKLNTLDVSPPQSRNLNDLLKLIFPELDIDEIFSKTVDKGVVKMKVVEKEMKEKVEEPIKNVPISIEGYIPKEEQKKYEEFNVFEPDDEKIELPTLSLYGIIWNEITRWITNETREYLFSKNEDISFSSLFQVFDENKLERLELIDTYLIDHLKLVCDQFKISNVEILTKKFKELVYKFDLNRPINKSLQRKHWMIIVLILLKSMIENDEILKKDLNEIEKKIEKLFDLKSDQFLILVDFVKSGE